MPPAKPVFVMVTAATCSHCANLHKRWTPIRETIQRLGTVRIKELNLPQMSSRVSAQGYPEDMQRYIGWFPTALLFNGDNWDAVMAKREKTLQGVIMNGQVGNPNPLSGVYAMDADGITRWITDMIPTLKVSDKSKSPKDPPSPKTVPYRGEICGKLILKSRRRRH